MSTVSLREREILFYNSKHSLVSAFGKKTSAILKKQESEDFWQTKLSLETFRRFS